MYEDLSGRSGTARHRCPGTCPGREHNRVLGGVTRGSPCSYRNTREKFRCLQQTWVPKAGVLDIWRWGKEGLRITKNWNCSSRTLLSGTKTPGSMPLRNLVFSPESIHCGPARDKTSCHSQSCGRLTHSSRFPSGGVERLGEY